MIRKKMYGKIQSSDLTNLKPLAKKKRKHIFKINKLLFCSLFLHTFLDLCRLMRDNVEINPDGQSKMIGILVKLITTIILVIPKR